MTQRKTLASLPPPLRIPARAGMLLAGMVLLCGAAPALSQYDPGAPAEGSDVALVCPCTVEPVNDNPNAVKVTASVKNHGETENGSLSLQLFMKLPHESTWKLSIDVGVVAAGESKPVSETVDIVNRDGASHPASAIHKVNRLLLAETLSAEICAGDTCYQETIAVQARVIFPDLPSVGLTSRITSIDYLTDTDKDGVSDYNERLMGTRPNDPDNKPGTVTLDIMGLYPANMEERGLEPMACMAHSVEWANMALRNSRIDARYRLVKTKSIEDDLIDGNEFLPKVQNETGLFTGIDAERVAAGADLLVVFRVGGGLGGLPSLEEIETDPDAARKGTVSEAHCGSGFTLAHELGHNLGLVHSARQRNAYGGVFRWSRGHGKDSDFVTIMAYQSSYYTYSNDTVHTVQFYSNPKLSLCGSENSPCGVERDQANAADAALSIRAVMYRVAQWAPDPPDTDDDGVIDFLDALPRDPAETVDTDGDKVGDNADNDDDNDGLSDAEEEELGTDPKDADTDGDSVNDGIDLFPRDGTRSIDADSDGIDASRDANDNDASVTWTRTHVTLTPDATVRANLIATFDNLAAIRADTGRYELTGVFADADIRSWNRFETYARVGVASVNTNSLVETGAGNVSATGTIKIKGITLAGEYINFLMTGGQYFFGRVGVRLLAAGTSTLLAGWEPTYSNHCNLRDDRDWRHFDVSALAGQSVDIEIYDNDSSSSCGSDIAFDHFYQSDAARGSLVGTASLRDTDGDGVHDGADAFPNDAAETADNDKDGIGDNADPDDDRDRVPDDMDAFPKDLGETVDTDGDGTGDNADAFDDDPGETADSDGDKVGDNEDTDDDNDGVPDDMDAFPRNPGETVDTDGDRIGDREDRDDDNDGLSDREEADLGTDPKNADTDGDGVNDKRDAEPNDVAVAYAPDEGQTLLPDGRDARNVVADFDDLAEMWTNTTKYELTGVFADFSLTNWNRFEAEDAAARAGN